MKIFSDWPIQLQLMFGIGSSVAVIFLLAISYNYSTLRKQIISESHLEINDAVITGVQDFISILDGIEKSTDMLANVTRFSNKSEEELQDLLRNTITTNKNIYGGAIAIDPGRSSSKRGYSPYYFRPSTGVVEFSNLAEKNYQYAEQQWFSGAQQRGRPFWSDPYYDDGGGNILMATYSVPVERDHRFYAVITGDISLDLIQESLQSIRFGETGHIILLDVHLNVISAPQTAAIMTPFLDTISNPGHLKEWQHLLTNFQQQSGEILHLPCPHTEGRCIIVASSMALTNWPMLVIYPEREMFSELRYFTVKFGLISLGTLILLLFLIWVISGKLTRQLTTLALAVARFGKGDLDLTLPASSENAETRLLATAFHQMKLQLQQYIEKLQQETARLGRLEGELTAATQIQMSMLPGHGTAYIRVPGIELWAHVLPAKSVGGDLYQFTIRPDNRLLFMVGDVSDKGVAAALFMASTVSLFKQNSLRSLSPAELLGLMNSALVEDNDAAMFVTLFVGEINLNSGDLIYSSAGHNPSILIKAGKASELEQDHGPAIGLIENAIYPNNTTRLQPEDKLFVYTDGVDEAFNDEREMFGISRLISFLTDKADLPVNTLGETCFYEVNRFAGKEPQSDDITILILEFEPRFRFLLEEKILSAITTIELHPEVSSLEQLFSELASFTETHGLENLNDLKLVCEEIIVNSIHYGGRHHQDIQVVLGLCAEGLIVEVVDSGRAYNPLVEAPVPELGLSAEDSAIGGLGVYLMKSLSSRQGYARKGTYNHLCLLLS